MSAASLAASSLASGRLAPGSEVVLGDDLEIALIVHPHEGDAWTRLAKRVTGDASSWKSLADRSHLTGSLKTSDQVRVPFSMLKPDLQRQVVQALFPSDRVTPEGWIHHVAGGDGDSEGEPLWKIAEWFTGDGANYSSIREANSMKRLSTRRGDTLLIPRSILGAAFAAAEVEKSVSRPLRKISENAVAVVASHTHEEDNAVFPEAVETFSTALEYHKEGDRPYAVYKLRKGEALYSSVIIRFTGRLFPKDVTDAVEEVVKFNGFGDVFRIPAGYSVKIPMEMLAAEYRPWDDPQRVERERSKRESARLAKRVEARNLKGVYIVLDPGHGGRDVGTEHGGVWESSYVYDVVCRLRKVLEENSAAKVFITTRSKGGSYEIQDRDVLKNVTDHTVLTTPAYDLEDPVVGVNLRWYLANSILKRARKRGVRPEKVVFISLHADSLHPSVRGTMAYIPGERYIHGTFSRTGAIYLARSEVRDDPVVSQSHEDALRASGASTELAESIIGSIKDADLKVHPFNPIRDNVVRDGSEWVPAVIRYNRIPARLLLEICNLGNSEDRRLIQTRTYRQSLAQAIYRGLVDFYDGREEGGSGGVVSGR
ncbi:MAG TPA: N-acetylmuramoyl-L-alanine amidase [Thermoanaerobaculia bacterium]|nr:N-acetylmuramoyl-L-alanine amidase [Thermoanaerobaculia bacterium]